MTNREALSAADQIIQTLIGFADHLYHGRPGLVRPAAHAGLNSPSKTWEPALMKIENGERVLYRLGRHGSRIGVINARGEVPGHGAYQAPGLFPAAVEWAYSQVAAVWKLDNEFFARWLSYAYKQQHRDLKILLASFALVQTRRGDPVMEEGALAFFDEDYRAVGEAAALLVGADAASDGGFTPKHLLRMHAILSLPEVAALNRKLGFGVSEQSAFLGRWPSMVRAYLLYRELNPQLLNGLVRAGFSKQLRQLARLSRYKPASEAFFAALRWEQKQSPNGHRTVGLKMKKRAVESWANFSEAKICETIVSKRPSWKQIASVLPSSIGITKAVIAAAIEAGSLSQKDLVLLTPTLESTGALEVKSIKARWEEALKASEDLRTLNVAKNVKTVAAKKALEAAADAAVTKAVEKVARGLRIYFVVDISGSMDAAIGTAKICLQKILQGFSPEKLHVAVFNTAGRALTIKSPSAAGVQAAFAGVSAGGGTSHYSGVRVSQQGASAPAPDEDALYIFVGDEGEIGTFEGAFGVFKPAAFGLLKLPGQAGSAVRDTASVLGIPCFELKPTAFDDPYAVMHTLQALIASTPVSQRVQSGRFATRVSLVDQILGTELLKKPSWA